MHDTIINQFSFNCIQACVHTVFLYSVGEDGGCRKLAATKKPEKALHPASFIRALWLVLWLLRELLKRCWCWGETHRPSPRFCFSVLYETNERDQSGCCSRAVMVKKWSEHWFCVTLWFHGEVWVCPYVCPNHSCKQISINSLREFVQLWHKCPLGLDDELNFMPKLNKFPQGVLREWFGQTYGQTQKLWVGVSMFCGGTWCKIF